MKVKHLILAGALASLSLTAAAGTLIIPAAGAGPGANGSVWKSEVSINNLSAKPAPLTLVFHDANGPAESADVTIPGRGTTSFSDIVATTFHRTSATGGIEIVNSTNAKLVVTSRTFNAGVGTGEFGQDIPAVDPGAVADAQQAVLIAPSQPEQTRFNFGIYAIAATNVTWRLVRADGAAAGTVERSYTAGQQVQYNIGVSALFGETAKPNDTIRAEYKTGAAIVYGSAVNNISGDPTFVPGIIAIPDSVVNFLGVDADEDGSVDIGDTNDDDIADTPIDLVTSLYPNFFRIVASGPNGEKVTFELVDNFNGDAALIDDNGTVEWAAGSNFKNSTATLKVRATVGNQSTILQIPAKFR